MGAPCRLTPTLTRRAQPRPDTCAQTNRRALNRHALVQALRPNFRPVRVVDSAASNHAGLRKRHASRQYSLIGMGASARPLCRSCGHRHDQRWAACDSGDESVLRGSGVRPCSPVQASVTYAGLILGIGWRLVVVALSGWTAVDYREVEFPGTWDSAACRTGSHSIMAIAREPSGTIPSSQARHSARRGGRDR